MDGTRQARADQLVAELSALPPAEQRSRLDAACNGDPELRGEVESRLLSHDDVATVVSASEEETVQSAPVMAQPDRTTIGSYRLIHEVGRGGMGVVYLAQREDDAFKRRVAVKLLKRGMDSEDVLRRFELERQVMASMNHPGIARLFDAGQTEDGLPYFVMEYVEGMELSAYCDRHRLDIDERLTLFRKVCEAVHHAHQNLVVHRDLKPSNIIVTEDAQPKLLDFGIAKLLNPDLAIGSGAPTAPEVRVMTPEYASPEQVRGEPITTASDVYSLGVLLYELLSGHAPYRLQSRVRAEMERVICNMDPERPSTAISRVVEVVTGSTMAGVAPTTSTLTPESVSQTRRHHRPERLRKRLAGDIDNIVLMAMRKEPQRRYSSAEQLAEDIQRHQDGLPVLARRDTLSYRVTKFVGRNRVGVSAAAMVALVLVGGIVGTTSGWRAAERGMTAADLARQAETQERQRAETERDRAERRFDEVRELAHTFMYDFHDAIVTLDGSVTARELLVTTALQYLDTLRIEVGERPDLKRELAAAYERVGDICGGIRNPSLGDIAAARRNYETALEVRRELLAASPDDEGLQRELSASQIRFGDALMQIGDTETAVAVYTEARDVRHGLWEKQPNDRDARRRLASAMSNVAYGRLATGDAPAAMKLYEESLAMRRDLAAELPDDTQLARDVSVACNRVGGRLATFGRNEDALRMFQESADIRRRLAGSDPFNTRWQRDLGTSLYFVGKTLIDMHREREALPILEEHVQIVLGRAVANPRDARTRMDVANAHDLIGQAYRRLCEREKAREHAEASLEAISWLARADPENLKYQMLLAGSQWRLGAVQRAEEDYAAAIASGRKSLATSVAVAQVDPANVRYQENVARVLLKLGAWLALDGQRGEAIRRLEEAKDRLTALLEADPSSASVRANLAATLAELANLMAGLQDGRAARGYADDAIATIYADAVAGEPDPPAKLLRGLAAAYSVAGDQSRAIELASEALDRIRDDDCNGADLRAGLEDDLRRYRSS
jgi:serine/threonine protein kinase